MIILVTVVREPGTAKHTNNYYTVYWYFLVPVRLSCWVYVHAIHTYYSTHVRYVRTVGVRCFSFHWILHIVASVGVLDRPQLTCSMLMIALGRSGTGRGVRYLTLHR